MIHEFVLFSQLMRLLIRIGTVLYPFVSSMGSCTVQGPEETRAELVGWFSGVGFGLKIFQISFLRVDFDLGVRSVGKAPGP